MCTAILAALDDAGLTVNDLDGFAIYSFACDPAEVAAILGVPEVRFAASLTSGGGGCAGAARARGGRDPRRHGERVRVGDVAAAAQPAPRWFRGRRRARVRHHVGGRRRVRRRRRHLRRVRRSPPTPGCCRRATASRCSRSATCTCTARRVTTSPRSRSRERANAIRRPTSLQKQPLTLDEYFAARMISDPLCLFDYTMESDGAVAVITTSADRAKDLRQPPAYILSSAHGGSGRWGPAIFRYFQVPDDEFASSGHRPVAKRLFEMAGVTPADVDVALLYDHFSPLVIMQLEDYGFCPIGEGGPFVAEGNMRWPQRHHPGEHPRRQPLGGVHHRHDARTGSGGADPGHRGQPGRRRGDRAGHRRSRRRCR